MTAPQKPTVREGGSDVERARGWAQRFQADADAQRNPQLFNVNHEARDLAALLTRLADALDVNLADDEGRLRELAHDLALDVCTSAGFSDDRERIESALREAVAPYALRIEDDAVLIERARVALEGECECSSNGRQMCPEFFGDQTRHWCEKCRVYAEIAARHAPTTDRNRAKAQEG